MLIDFKNSVFFKYQQFWVAQLRKKCSLKNLIKKVHTKIQQILTADFGILVHLSTVFFTKIGYFVS